MTSYLFFEVGKVAIQKTSTMVSDELNKKGHKSELYLIPGKFVKVSKNFFSELNRYKIKVQKKIENADVLIIQGYGFWEIYALAYAEKINKKIAYIQHGIYSQKISRINSSVFKNYSFSLSKILTLISIVLLIPNRSIMYKFNWIFFYFFGSFYPGRRKDNLMNVSCMYLMGEYWKNWHSNVVGMISQKYEIFQYPDVKLQQFDKANKYKIVFICQSYVEDGRLSRDYYKSFLNKVFKKLEIAGFSSGEIAIKLHPRSDMEFYKNLPYEKFRYGKIPMAKVYLTGWSTLTFLCATKGEVVLVSPNKKEIPLFLLDLFKYLDPGKRDFVTKLSNIFIKKEEYKPSKKFESYVKILPANSSISSSLEKL